MKLALLSAAVLTQLLFATGLAHGQSQADEGRLQALYTVGSQLQTPDKIQDRLLLFSSQFLREKSPYLVDPLGEGENGEFSKAPLYRFDGFDCTTFVETVLALALSSSPEQFRQRMNQIRYKDAVISYESRNHFPSIDWIPNNTRAGFVTDVTGRVAGAHTKWSQTWIQKATWFEKKGPAYRSVAQLFDTELGQLPYISKEDLLNRSELIQRIPNGSIFHVVRPNWDLRKAIGTHLDVSHMGFLVWDQGVLYMLHASNGAGRDGSDDSKRVKREPLLEYVSRVMMPSPSTAGINILTVTGVSLGSLE